MGVSVPGGRRTVVVEIVICTALLAIVSLNALRRMDYLSSATAHHIRMTDASRSAYVGKNIAEGNGYTTNDLPDSLIDFYDQRGKLHEDRWVNADRFPFSAYATAALYTITQSTSEEVGILAYNLICFVGFLTLLYAFARNVWGQRWSPLLGLVLALAHPYTYIYLYLKDADMLFLATGAMWAFYEYFRAPPESTSKRHAIVLGTLLAWLFLARPNVGAPFVLVFGLVAGLRLRRRAREAGWSDALRVYALREGLTFGIAALWLVPFVIHSMAEWGSPLFSANNMYQLPLGTRFGMGTDTWWKYTEPGHPITLGTILAGDRAHLIGKFTSSWVATVRSLVMGFAIELALLIGAVAWLRRGDAEGETPARRPLRALALTFAFAALLNLAVLPLYGYQDYAYRHYLGFVFPLMWLLGGHALYLLLALARPHVEDAIERVRKRPGLWIAIAIAGVLIWNIGSNSALDGSRLASRSANFFALHWVGALIALVLFALRRWIFRPPWFPRAVLAGFSIVYACYRPDSGIKRSNLIWFPADEHVWQELAKRKGIVSSFALQGEVAWNTGRKNIPVPEWPMHLYSFALDHKLEIEDVYIESAESLLSPLDGPFSWMAPGFEGYQRLQQYPGHLPGYELAFHVATTRAYPKYKVKAHAKASTVYKLVDRSAIAEIARSPEHIDLGAEANVIYTAHGWGRYMTYDGKQVAMATDSTRARYHGESVDVPWEDTSVTFFVDDRHPTSVDLDFYAPLAARYTFYWNLDLYAYDLPGERPHHQIGVVETKEAGWQHVTLAVPSALVRRGLNKLGFRTSAFQPLVFCEPGASDEGCLQRAPAEPGVEEDGQALVIHQLGVAGASREYASMYATELVFHYGLEHRESSASE